MPPPPGTPSGLARLLMRAGKIAMGELSPWRSVLPPRTCLGLASAQGVGRRRRCLEEAWGEGEVRLLLRAEVDAWGLHLRWRNVEGRHRLGGGVEHRAPDAAREGGDLGVIDAHRLDVVAPRDRDPVLRAFELRLQRQEV